MKIKRWKNLFQAQQWATESKCFYNKTKQAWIKNWDKKDYTLIKGSIHQEAKRICKRKRERMDKMRSYFLEMINSLCQKTKTQIISEMKMGILTTKFTEIEER